MKLPTKVQEKVGRHVLRLVAVFSFGAAGQAALSGARVPVERMDQMEAIQNTRIDQMEAVQNTVVAQLDTIGPMTRFLYCKAKKESEGIVVGPFTCDPNREN